jgi:inhibitor of cysteine peptidase
MKRTVILPAAMCILALALIFVAATGAERPAVPLLIEAELPVVGSSQKLRELLSEVQKHGAAITVVRGPFMLAGSTRAMDAGSSAPTAKSSSSSDTGYSGTNVQVQGVDEADLVKTDGRYIYQVNNRRVVITRAFPADLMEVASILTFEDNFTPQELYIDEKHLVVIGSTHFYQPYKETVRQDSRIMIYPPLQSTVKAIIYDLSDRNNVRYLREVEVDGYYISSRKIGDALYLVANKHIDYYIMEGTGEIPVPIYRDSAGSGDYLKVGYDNIRYFPHSVEPNYLIVASLDLAKPAREMAVQTYLGAGENIYASTGNLYIAVTEYRQDSENAEMMRPDEPFRSTTGIYRFALALGSVNYSGQGEVPGRVLNQFSMDEHNGFFRIATTSGDMWRNDEHTSKNNVYILDNAMNIAGRLENLAPGERIYSARFMGDRGYMVTFRDVDPLFVIDLKDPRSPKVLGELKIPGYSDYLHPYDENHLLGFGKDTVELEVTDWNGGKRTMAFYMGMKVSLFDVSDVENPIEKFKTIIGDRGTESELLHNHKALLFNRELNLLSFPVTVMELKGPARDPYGFPPFGEFAYQGAYVYEIDPATGFSLKGRITHMGENNNKMRGHGWYGGGENVERILYIGDTLYTLSGAMIKANNISSLAEVNSLSIP